MKADGAKVKSAPETTPLYATRADAQALCANSFASGRLPTNAEWTRIATLARENPLNWTGGSVNAGELVTGLTRRWGDPVSVQNESDPYDQTGFSASNTPAQRRTIYVGSDVLWDFGGNAWEWVSDSMNGASFTPSFDGAWAHDPNDTYWFPNASPQLDLFFGVRPGSHPLGFVFGGTSGTVLRGAGTYMYSNEVGLFNADLGTAANGTASPRNYGLPGTARNIGFRCVTEKDTMPEEGPYDEGEFLRSE